MMQKKLIVVTALAAAIALPLTAVADNANVTVYGIANLSLDMTKNGNTATKKSASANKVSSSASRIGFKGSEDLGEGLSALWQIESRVDMDNAGGSFATRNTFAGLKGESWGQVILGRHDTPYKLATRRLDMFGDSLGDNRALMGGAVKGKNSALQFDGRPNDVVMYTSPGMGGVTLLASYVAGAEAASSVANIKGKTMSVAGLYEDSALFASLAYQVNDIGTADTGNNACVSTTTAPCVVGSVGVKEKALKVGAGYKFGDFETGLAYEKTSDDISTLGSVIACKSASTDTNCYGHKAVTVSGKYKLGNGAIKLALAKSGELGNSKSSGAKQMTVGYDHSLSKRTTLYAIYTKLSNDVNASYGLAAEDAGTSTGNVKAQGKDADPSALSFGMKHIF